MTILLDYDVDVDVVNSTIHNLFPLSLSLPLPLSICLSASPDSTYTITGDSIAEEHCEMETIKLEN